MTKRKLTPSVTRAILADLARSMRYEDIAAKHDVSVGTIANAKRKGQPKRPGKDQRSSQAPSGSAPAPSDAAGLDRLIATAERLVREAEAEENLSGVATMGRLLATLHAERRKASPPPTPDELGMMLVPISEMDDLGGQVAARLHKMLDLVADEACGPPCRVCGRPMPSGLQTS